MGDINELDAVVIAEIERQAGTRLAQGSFIRTEKVHILTGDQTAPAGSIVCSGRVKNREFLGATTKTTIALNHDASLTTLSFDGTAVPEETPVRVWFSPADVLVLS